MLIFILPQLFRKESIGNFNPGTSTKILILDII